MTTPEGVSPEDWQAYLDASAAMWRGIEADRVAKQRAEAETYWREHADDAPPVVTVRNSHFPFPV